MAKEKSGESRESRQNFPGSLALRRFLRSISIGLALGAFTFCLGYLPQDDLLQGLWIFGTTTFSAFLAFKKQSSRFEEREDRYKRVARETLLIRLEEDPHLTSNLLLGQDVPVKWIEWMEHHYGVNLMQCRAIHAVDSFYHFGDSPGQGLTRVTCWVAELLQEKKQASSEEKLEIVSQALEKLVADSQHVLGEQFHPGFFFCNIESGPMPYGIFMESKDKGAKALATTYKAKAMLNKKVVEVQCARLGLNIVDISAQQWEQLVEEIDTLLPCFDRKNLGEGPRSLSSQLFIQETQDINVEQFHQRIAKLPELLHKYEAHTEKTEE